MGISALFALDIKGKVPPNPPLTLTTAAPFAPAHSWTSSGSLWLLSALPNPASAMSAVWTTTLIDVWSVRSHSPSSPATTGVMCRLAAQRCSRGTWRRLTRRYHPPPGTPLSAAAAPLRSLG